MASEYTPDWLLFNPVNANPSQPKNIEVTFGYDNYYTLNANTTHYWCAWDKIDQWSELVVDSPSSGVAEPVFFFLTPTQQDTAHHLNLLGEVLFIICKLSSIFVPTIHSTLTTCGLLPGTPVMRIHFISLVRLQNTYYQPRSCR